MIQYEITDDAGFINSCLTSPVVWRMGSDDSMAMVNPNLFFAQLGNRFFLKAGDYGLLVGIPVNSIMLDVHVALLPTARGKAADICLGALMWMANNTQYVRFVASIPEYNKLAIKLAMNVGMQCIGVNEKSFMKNGNLVNQILFGISKEDLCHQ